MKKSHKELIKKLALLDADKRSDLERSVLSLFRKAERRAAKTDKDVVSMLKRLGFKNGPLVVEEKSKGFTLPALRRAEK